MLLGEWRCVVGGSVGRGVCGGSVGRGVCGGRECGENWKVVNILSSIV